MKTAELVWRDQSPFSHIPLRGTKARGRAYERKVGKYLHKLAPELGFHLQDHKWLEFDGIWIQPDFVLEFPGGSALLLEAKLTYTRQAFEQLARYGNILEPYYSSVVPALVCRNLTYEMTKPVRDFFDITPWSTWHLFL